MSHIPYCLYCRSLVALAMFGGGLLLFNSRFESIAQLLSRLASLLATRLEIEELSPFRTREARAARNKAEVRRSAGSDTAGGMG